MSAELNGRLPWTRSCFVCGADNPRGLHARAQVVAGKIRLEYTPTESDRGYRHLMHGGLAMTLMDEVMTWAAILDCRRVCVAADFTVRLRRPMPIGVKIVVTGWVAENHGRLLYAAAEICSEAGEILCRAEGKYVPMPEAQLHLCEKDFVTDAGTLPLAEIIPGLGRGATLPGSGPAMPSAMPTAPEH